jgi:hypothetical protein
MRAQDLLLVPRYLDRGLELKRNFEGANASLPPAIAAVGQHASVDASLMTRWE